MKHKTLLLLIPFLAALAASAQGKKWKAVEGIFVVPGAEEELHTRFVAKDTALIFYWESRQIALAPESDTVWINRQERQLKPFEGLYQMQGQDFAFIQLSSKDNQLVLKQRWDGEEIRFLPKTGLDFFSKERPNFLLTFSRDKDGSITGFLAFKTDRWTRIKKVEPTAEQLQAVSGKYQSADDPDNWLEVIPRDKTLILKQVWDGKTTVFEAQTDTYYYNDGQAYSLNFIKDKEGKVVQVLVLMKDLFNKVKD